MNDSPDRELVVFLEAVDLPDDERAAYLERACGGDTEMRQRIEALLKTHDRVGNFLEESPQKAAIEARPGVPIGEKPGDRIGHYKLLQEIGEGGCGVVFMAEQEEPVRRRVALKVVKPGMDTKIVIARFEAERQALALMNHPNIAQVFEAGATETGRPYFVMELVRGVKITEYCDQHSLTTTARLELFIQVCDAIQHAHQKGIIHRDIKPSNILVTTTPEGKALPKVIDFGIAKATTGQRLTDKTLFTAFEMLIGTPAYMSPEQATLSSVDVDTRTDIYSLGVLLYELLTGNTPFDTQELLKAGLDEVRRVIGNQEPVRPSTRLNTMAASALTSVSQHHQADPSKLIRDVRGDLDWIVMKALEKDRARRYATANGLALDVQRYLTGEMVLARPPSSLYRFQKLFLRHKFLFSGFGIVFFLVVALLVFMSQLYLQEKQLRQKSDLLLADTQAYAYIHDGKPEEAEQVYTRALEIRRRLNPGYMPTSQSLEILVWALLNQYKFDKAEALLTEFLAPANSGRKEYFGLLCLRADVLARSGQWAKAEADAARILVDTPEDHGAYHRLAPLEVANNDQKNYHDLCEQIVARFSNATFPVVADQMAKDCLILPSSGVNLAPVEAMAETAVSSGQLAPAYAFYQETKALVEYRTGHFDIAAKWAQWSAENPFPYSQAEAYATLAMAQYQLKQTDKARATLAKCKEIVEEKLPQIGRDDLGDDWRDWIIVHALFTEAKKLIGTTGAFRVDPNLESERVRRFEANLDAVGRDSQQAGRLWQAKAEDLARHCRWSEAITTVTNAMGLLPGNSTIYHTLVPLVVETGDRGAYERLCNQITVGFSGESNPGVADQMAKDCLILFRPGADLTVPGALAETAVTRGKDSPAFNFFQACKSLAEYRQGHWTTAIDWAQQAAQNPFPYSQAESSAVLAMSQYQLKQIMNARGNLAKCSEIVETKLPKLDSGDLGQDWRDWIIAHALLTEAKGLIKGANGTNGGPPEK